MIYFQSHDQNSIDIFLYIRQSLFVGETIVCNYKQLVENITFFNTHKNISFKQTKAIIKQELSSSSSVTKTSHSSLLRCREKPAVNT